MLSLSQLTHLPLKFAMHRASEILLIRWENLGSIRANFRAVAYVFKREELGNKNELSNANN